MLDNKVKQQILKLYEELNNKGELLSKSKLDAYREVFKNKFGPDKLSSLDGEALLTSMHDFADKGNSLVYWLEFKDDEEFPANFGSIAGGSALKYEIYKSKDTGSWMAGNPLEQREIKIEEAIDIARKHKDHLLKGVSLLENLPSNGTDDDYKKLQLDIDTLAPSISDTAWGHKYLSLLFPDKLDDYHNADYQRYHLVKLLETPPVGEGRYLCAGKYVAIAKELGIPINNLTTITNFRDSSPHNYWRIGTSEGDTGQNHWREMRDGNYIAVGWRELGDLSGIEKNRESKTKLRELLQKYYSKTNASVIGRWTQQLFSFLAGIQDRDIVVAADGEKILGIGRVTGEYRYDEALDFPHIRPVEWLSQKEWKLPVTEGLRTTLHLMKKDFSNPIEIEKHILYDLPVPPSTTSVLSPLEGIPFQIQSILNRKGQVIIYGPPGTGKTYWALETANELAARSNFKLPYGKLDDAQKNQVNGTSGNPLVRICCFHPAYGYEDFLEGYRPGLSDGQMRFSIKDGIFKQVCQDATANTQNTYYLIIDEINRGDIPKIFGELITLLEKDKRGKKVMLPLSGQMFQVPINVCIIGTMNTADRSIALVDTALRRRFGFVSLMPDISLLMGSSISGIPLGPWLSALNQRILQYVGHDARNLQIGHAYFLEGGKPIHDLAKFIEVVRQDIIPLLEEYCYEDYSAIGNILGNNLVDIEKQRIREELFEEVKRGEFIQALLAPNPEISASAQAVVTDKEAALEQAEEKESEAENEDAVEKK
ncbi:MAG: hypothetical protein AMXMBFR85_07940 [Dehalococcoides mccartyi]|nr:AAA family ATPase [Dehalococcoides mccartyi]